MCQGAKMARRQIAEMKDREVDIVVSKEEEGEEEQLQLQCSAIWPHVHSA